MTAPRTPAAPWLQALFCGLIRLLPEVARRSWGRAARQDLAELLRRTRHERGRIPAWWAGLRALADLAMRLPAEWRRASTTHERAGPTRHGMGESMMEGLREVRRTIRTLLRRPGYSVAATLTLALGIGGSVAVFTVIDAVLLQPLPYPDSGRIVSLRHHAPGLDFPELNNSDGMIRFYRSEADFLETLAAFGTAQRNVVGGDRPERVTATQLSPEGFQVLGIQPRMGRAFVAADAEEDAPPVAILTHGAWVERYGATPDILGRSLIIDGAPTEIVGVMPAGFAFPTPESRLLQPLRVDPDGPFGAFGVGSIGRLAPGVSVNEAARQARALQTRIPDFFPDGVDTDFLDRAGWDVTLERYQDRLVGDQVASLLWIVLATVGVVLLIACANVANLFLVRAESRQKELAVRAAMGAGAGRVARGFFTESLLLGLCGGVLGSGIAWAGVTLLVRYGPRGLPRLHEVALGPAEVGASALLAVGTGIALGILPALRYRGEALAGLLRDGGRTATDGRSRHRARHVLVAGQLSLALVLLVGSTLMLRSFQAMRSVELGFDPGGLFTAGLSLGEGTDNAQSASFYSRVADEVAALPGIASVGLATLVPLGEGSANGGSFYLESRPRVEGDLPPVAMYKAVDSDYLATLDQPLLRGRLPERSEWEGGGEAVALVNETFARRFLDGDGLGDGIKWDEDVDFARVVGVVADAREQSLTEASLPWVYLPMVVPGWGYPSMERAYLLVRTAGAAPLSSRAVREIVQRLDPTVPLTSVRSMEDVIGEETSGTSFTMTLLLLAAATALFLGAIGLFGVVSYVVGRRTREIGVRVALGAEGRDIRALVLRQGSGVVLVGVIVGLGAAFALSRLMASVLFGVSTTDPVSFVVAPAALVGVALLATWLPARRASRVDPVEALRGD